MTVNISYLQTKIEEMISDARRLLGTVIEQTAAEDKKAKARESKWFERHRLHVLVEAAQESLRRLPEEIRDPWLVAELSALLDVIRTWRNDPLWTKIEPSLVNPTEFSHVIATLLVAEHWKGSGHRVELVPTDSRPTPDLKVQAIGGKQEWLQVECYQPKLLAGRPVRIYLADAFKILKEAMKKAKFQLGSEIPGILALCTYNQPVSNLEVVSRAALARLAQTSRAALSGIMLFSQNNLATRSPTDINFSPIVMVEFIQNPAYFGSIEMNRQPTGETTRSGGTPLTEIREPLTETVVRDFTILQREIDKIENSPTPAAIPKAQIAPIRGKVERLRLLPREPYDRAIIIWAGSKYSWFFEGEGNIDYVCASCGTILSKRAWQLSLTNVVVQCPNCLAYNEFPVQQANLYTKTNNIVIEPGRYSFSGTVFLERGACLIGGVATIHH